MKEDFIDGNWITAIEGKKENKSIEAGSSLLALSIALPVQVTTTLTFGTSLSSLSVNLVERAATHNVCSTDSSLTLELHGLQPEC